MRLSTRATSEASERNRTLLGRLRGFSRMALPLSTMPLQVLTALPKLEEGLEYRFAGDRLILMDTHANLIIDFTGNVLP